MRIPAGQPFDRDSADCDRGITLRVFCAALAVIVALIALLWIAYPPRYLTNDDVAIRLGIEGNAFPGQGAVGFVLMTHSALGWSLVWLQRVFPAAPVWDMTVVGILVCAIAVCLGLTWSMLGPSFSIDSLRGCAVLVAILPLVANVQFTMGPTLAGGAAVLIDGHGARPGAAATNRRGGRCRVVSRRVARYQRWARLPERSSSDCSCFRGLYGTQLFAAGFSPWPPSFQ